MFLIEDSAMPLDMGLYGDDSSWLMLLSRQNCLNSERNWGPPSDLMCVGHEATEKNHSLSCLMTALVSSLFSLAAQEKALYRSTMTSQC